MEAINYPRMHVSLYVSNIDRTTDFYSRVFDKSPEKVKPGYAKYHLDKPSLVISFVENAEKAGPSFGHLGLQVETDEEVFALRDKMKTMGIEVQEEMGTNCCYAEQDKFWVSDPDGYMWEVYVFKKDVEFNDPRYVSGEASACCAPSHRSTEKENTSCC